MPARAPKSRTKQPPAKGRAARGGKSTGKTTGTKKPAKIPQPHGGALNSGGTPGNKGGTGRPPNEHVEWCRSVVDDPRSREQVAAVLRDRDHPAFATMWKVLAERGHGKVAERHEHAGPGGTAIAHEMVVRLVRPDGDARG